MVQLLQRLPGPGEGTQVERFALGYDFSLSLSTATRQVGLRLSTCFVLSETRGILFLVFEGPLRSTGLHVLTLHNAYCGQWVFFIPTFLRPVVVEVRCGRRGTRLILCGTCGGR